MALPNLPSQGQNPWFTPRNNWDLAVKSELEGRLSQESLDSKYDREVFMRAPGIDPSGVVDSTAAMQAFIDANPLTRIVIPTGFFLFSELTCRSGQRLVGSGRATYRDRYSTFGTSGWMVNSNFGGTVLRSTSTSGTAIKIVDPSEVTEGGLENLTLIGPGSGTSVGVQIGGISPIKSTVNPQVRNVAIGNFSVGAKLAYVNEGDFDSWIIRGCVDAIQFVTDVNDNVFTKLDMQWCTNGATISSNSYANTFVNPIAQSLSGSGFIISGSKNAIYNPYFEGIGVDAVRLEVTANANKVDSPALFTSSPIRVIASAPDNELSNVGWSGSAATIVDGGIRTRISGKIENISGAATRRLIIDPQNQGSPFGPWAAWTPTLSGTGWALGNGTLSGRYTRIGSTIHLRLMIVFGSTSTFGSVSPTINLPFNPLTRGLFGGFITRNSVGPYPIFPRISTDGSTTVTIWAMGTGGLVQAVTSTTPATWASGDTLEIYGTYETT